MHQKLDIDALRALRAIDVSGGVTNASRGLGVSQSAVSHKIKRLETALDCVLLTRRPNEPLFTDAGQRLLDYATRILSLHDEALADLGKKTLHGDIRLGMTEDATTSEIANILGRFTRLYPDVRVRSRSSQSLNVQAWLDAGELDLAMMQVFDHDVQPSDHALFRDTLHWVKSRDLPLDLSRSIPFLSFDKNCFYRRWGLADGQHDAPSFETVLECPSAAGIRSAVLSGLGVALLNGMHITEDIDIIENVFPDPPGLTFVARVGRGRRLAAIKALVQEIAREYSQRAV